MIASVSSAATGQAALDRPLEQPSARFCRLARRAETPSRPRRARARSRCDPRDSARRAAPAPSRPARRRPPPPPRAPPRTAACSPPRAAPRSSAPARRPDSTRSGGACAPRAHLLAQGRRRPKRGSARTAPTATSVTSPPLRNSSNARNATACSTRLSDADLAVEVEPRATTQHRPEALEEHATPAGTAAPCARGTRTAARPPAPAAQLPARPDPGREPTAWRAPARTPRARRGRTAPPPAAREATQPPPGSAGTRPAARRGPPAASSGSSSSASSPSPRPNSARTFSSKQPGDEDEELPARLEVELVPLGQPLAELDDDRGHVDVPAGSSSLRTSVKSRSNGPSNASRSRSSSPTIMPLRR